MTMRLLLAAALTTGLLAAPAAFARDAKKAALNKSKAHKPVGKSSRPSAKMNKPDETMGGLYSTQKDEMTR